MSKRKGLSKSTRFEVFKRDSFTCQYCGMKAPDVILQVDHIHPVAEGGENEMLNLLTSCDACNSGKGARRLGDQTTLSKQREQLAALQERREQIDMMLAWQRGLISLESETSEKLAELWSELAPGWSLNEDGKSELRKIIMKSGVVDAAAAMRKAATDYIEIDNGKATAETVNLAWSKVGKIAAFAEVIRAKPHMRQVMYIRGILRNRLSYVKEWDARDLLDRAFQSGVSESDLMRLAKTATSWSDWQNTMWRWIGEVETENGEDEKE